jgi:predicted  nucleic acid-binding Zn-ribbon protein
MSAWHRSSVLAVLGILLLSGLGVAVSNEAAALPTSDPLWTATQSENAFPQVAITKDGRYLAYTNSYANALSLYDANDPSGVALWTKAFGGLAFDFVLPVAFSGDGMHVAVATHQNDVVMYSVPEGAELWNTHFLSPIYSVTVDGDGSDTYLGMADHVIKLDETGLVVSDYYRDVGGNYFTVDTNDLGNMAIAVSSPFVAILDENMLDGYSVAAAPGTVFTSGKLADGGLDAAWLNSDGNLTYFAAYLGGGIGYREIYDRDLNVAMAGAGSLDISDDGNTVFGFNGDIVFMFSATTRTMLWSVPSMAGIWGPAHLSGDGSLGMLGGESLGASFFGREDGQPLRHLDRFDLRVSALSSNGATAVTGNQTEMGVYRGALDLSLAVAEGAAYFGQTTVVNVLLTVDGVPVEGATVVPSFSVPAVAYSVTDLGQGFYQINVLLASGTSPLTLRVDVVASSVGQQPAQSSTTIVLRADPFQSLSDQLAAAQDELAAHIAESENNLSAQIDASQSDLSMQMTMMWAALRSQMSVLESNVTGRIDALGSSIAGQLSTIGGNVLSVQTGVNGLTTSMASLNTKVTAIQTQLGQVNANLTLTRATMDAIALDVSDVLTRVTAMQTAVSDVRAALTTMQLSITSVNANVNSLRSQVSGLDATLSGVRAQITAMDQVLNSTVGSIEDLQASLDALTTSVASVRTGMIELQSSTNAGFENVRVGMLNLNIQIAAASSNITALSAQLGNVNAAVNTIQASTDDIKGKSDNSFLFGVLGMIVTVAMGLLIVFLLTRKKDKWGKA